MNNNFYCLSDSGKELYGTAAILHRLFSDNSDNTAYDFSADLAEAKRLIYELGYDPHVFEK